MKWITRKDIKVDRVACRWLIKRFIDPSGGILVRRGEGSAGEIVATLELLAAKFAG